MFEKKASEKKVIEAFNKIDEEQSLQNAHINHIYEHIQELIDEVEKLKKANKKGGK